MGHYGILLEDQNQCLLLYKKHINEV